MSLGDRAGAEPLAHQLTRTPASSAANPSVSTVAPQASGPEGSRSRPLVYVPRGENRIRCIWADGAKTGWKPTGRVDTVFVDPHGSIQVVGAPSGNSGNDGIKRAAPEVRVYFRTREEAVVDSKPTVVSRLWESRFDGKVWRASTVQLPEGAATTGASRVASVAIGKRTWLYTRTSGGAIEQVPDIGCGFRAAQGTGVGTRVVGAPAVTCAWQRIWLAYAQRDSQGKTQVVFRERFARWCPSETGLTEIPGKRPWQARKPLLQPPPYQVRQVQWLGGVDAQRAVLGDGHLWPTDQAQPVTSGTGDRAGLGILSSNIDAAGLVAGQELG